MGQDEPKSDRLIEGRDYYFDERGLMVLTREYLARRGTCCRNGCRHCPYGYGPEGAARDRAARSQGGLSRKSPP